jgi:hypothetical protein
MTPFCCILISTICNINVSVEGASAVTKIQGLINMWFIDTQTQGLTY